MTSDSADEVSTPHHIKNKYTTGTTCVTSPKCINVLSGQCQAPHKAATVTTTKPIKPHLTRRESCGERAATETLSLCGLGICGVSCVTPEFYQLRAALYLRIAPEIQRAPNTDFYLASDFQVSITLSGLSEIELMPSSANQCAKSGWSLGP